MTNRIRPISKSSSPTTFVDLLRATKSCQRLMESYLRELAGFLLGLPAIDVGLHQRLKDLGFDTAMLTDLGGMLATCLDITLSREAASPDLTIAELASHVMKDLRIQSVEPVASFTPIPPMPVERKLSSRRISGLPFQRYVTERVNYVFKRHHAARDARSSSITASDLFHKR